MRQPAGTPLLGSGVPQLPAGDSRPLLRHRRMGHRSRANVNPTPTPGAGARPGQPRRRAPSQGERVVNAGQGKVVTCREGGAGRRSEQRVDAECAHVHRGADVPGTDLGAFGSARSHSSIRHGIATPVARPIATPVSRRPISSTGRAFHAASSPHHTFIPPSTTIWTPVM